jgi:hypothetical protein
LFTSKGGGNLIQLFRRTQKETFDEGELLKSFFTIFFLWESARVFEKNTVVSSVATLVRQNDAAPATALTLRNKAAPATPAVHCVQHWFSVRLLTRGMSMN